MHGRIPMIHITVSRYHFHVTWWHFQRHCCKGHDHRQHFFKFHLPGRSIPVESLPSGYGWLISASSLPRDRRPQTACLHPVLSSVVSHFILMGISGSPFSSRVATHPWKYLNFFLLNSRPWKYLKTGQAGAWRVLEFHFTAPWKSLNSPSQTMRYQQLR